MPVFKIAFTKSKPREIVYRNYRKFNKNNFNQDLHNQSFSQGNQKTTSFEKTFLSILEEHAPLKKKLLHANHAPYVTKAFRKAIMRRSYSEKMYFRKRTPTSLKKYKKQKNCNSMLYKKGHKVYFDELNTKKVSDNKSFWKYVQFLFSEIQKIRKKIALVDENENIISEEHLVSEELKNFFRNATKSLQINDKP